MAASDTDVQISVGAETSGVAPAFADVSSKLDAALAHMTQQFTTIGAASKVAAQETAQNFSQMVSPVDQSQQAIRFYLKSIADSMQNLPRAAQKAHGDTEKHTQGIGALFGRMRETINGHMEASVSIVESFRGKIALIGGVLAGGFLWKESVDEMIKFRGEVVQLENVMGMQSDKATQMAVALKLIGSSSDEYTGVALKMGRVLKTQPEEFERLGVTIKDSAGNLLPMDQIMQNSFATMQTYKAGTDQAEFALSVFGRSVKDVYTLMQLTPSTMDRATQLMHDYGIEMGPARQAEIQRYRIEVNAFKIGIEAIADRIGEAVLPSLMQMAQFFNDIGPGAATIFVDAIKVVLTAMATLASLTSGVIASVVADWKNLVSVGSAARDIVNMPVGDLFNGNVSARIKQANTEIVASNKQATKEIEDAYIKLGDRVGKLWEEKKPGADVGGGPLKSGNRSFVSKPKAGTETSAMSDLENQLKAQRDAYNDAKLDQGSFETWSEQMTRDYWARVLEQTDLSVKDRTAVESKLYDAKRKVMEQDFAATVASLETEKAAFKTNYEERIRIAQQEYDIVAQHYGAQSRQAQEAYKKILEERQKLAEQIIKLGEIEQKATETRSKSAITLEQTHVQQQLALRQINAQQAFAMEEDLQNRLYALDVNAVNKQIALEQTTTKDPVRLAQLNAQLETREEQHELKITQIHNQAELERKQYSLQAQQSVQDSFATALDAVITRTKSLRDAFADMVRSIANELVKLSTQKFAKDLLGPGTQAGGALGGMFDKLFGVGGGGTAGEAAGMASLTTATTTTATSMTALDTVMMTLSTAASTAASALAQVGASGGLSGLGGGGGLFDGGGFDAFTPDDVGGLGGIGSLFDLPMLDVGTPYVPQDTLAIVHKGEAVIPAAYNKPGAGGSVMNAGGIHNHFHGPVDRKSLNQANAATYDALRRAAYRNR